MMNAHDTAVLQAPSAADAAFCNAPRMTRMLGRLAGLNLALLLATFLPDLLARWHPWSAALAAPAAVPAGPGMLPLSRGALLVSLTGLLATCLITAARARRLHDAGSSSLVRLAGTPQALVLCAGAGLALLSLSPLWIMPGPAAAPVALGGATLLLAAGLLLAGFLLLVGERAAALIDPASLPEARGLAAMMRLPAIVLPALAVLCALDARAPLAVLAGQRILAVLVAASAVETAVRTLGVWYAPPPLLSARAAVGSLVVTLLDPRHLSPASLGVSLSRSFGIDFARSWALAFARRAVLPVLAVLLCLCWLLSGASRVALGQRAIYERFGAPAAVLNPGLHLLLPWPLGRARIVEYGIVHSILLSDAAAAEAAVSDRSTAEGLAPASANRLWDQSGAETSYLVARVDDGRQSFEAVSVDLRVLYRIGLSPQAARDALYDTADPQLLVRALARRLLSRLLAAQTLSDVMVERHDQLAQSLRRALQAQLDASRSGIEIVGLVVESLHPPAGAASAYRAVQAAEIAARMAITEERGRAHGTASIALRDANDTIDAARGQAAETVQSALAEQTRMLADDRAWHVGGAAFLMERRFADLRIGLGRAPLEIIDSRLLAPLLDLRPGAPSNPASDIDQEGRAP